MGYWSLDRTSNALFWSDEVCRIHGTAPSSYKPTFAEALEFYHLEGRAKVRREVDRVRQKGGQFHFRHLIIDAKGKTIEVDSFGLARKDAQGKVGRVIGVFRAVT